MGEDVAAADANEARPGGSAPTREELAARLRRAESLLRLPSQVRYDQPLDETLAALARTIVEETGAIASGVTLLDPADLSAIAVASCGLPPGYLEGVSGARQNAEAAAHLRRYTAEGRTWVLRDAPTVMLTLPEYAHMADVIRQVPFDTLVGTPFMARAETIGVVYLYYAPGVAVDDDEVAFARTIAEHARPLMDNAWLFSETERRANELGALYRADEALHRSLRIDDVEQAMVDLAIELLGASSSLVVTWDESDRLAVQATNGLHQYDRDRINARYQGISRERFAAWTPPYRTALVEDVDAHPRVRFEPPLAALSLAEIPVVVGDELWGFFSIGWRQRRTFSEEDRRLFDAFASRASLAIQNAMLFDRAQEAGLMEERQRIARELHDSVSQALYGIGLGARTALRRLADSSTHGISEPLEYIVELAESGLAETRALIFELVPESLEEQGLVLALQRQAAAIQSRFRVEVSAYLGDEPALPLRAKEALYRIAQESLHNMAKHAKATNASVSLTAGEHHIVLTIRDDGVGFDPTADFPGHFGLRSMEERARRIGGVYAIRSTAGEGTEVTVSLRLAD